MPSSSVQWSSLSAGPLCDGVMWTHTVMMEIKLMRDMRVGTALENLHKSRLWDSQ